jgi:hypothetical protein
MRAENRIRNRAEEVSALRSPAKIVNHLPLLSLARSGMRRSLAKLHAKVDSKELQELDEDWELETRPGIFTRLVIALGIAIAAVSGGTLLLRIVASIFAIFLSSVRYIFISAVLLFILSLLWA